MTKSIDCALLQIGRPSLRPPGASLGEANWLLGLFSGLFPRSDALECPAPVLLQSWTIFTDSFFGFFLLQVGGDCFLAL